MVVKRQKKPVKVYNLTIDDYHTYYVSEYCVLVHNKCKNGNYDDHVTSERMGKQKGNEPRDNKKQNKQIDKIAKSLNLSKDDRRELHDLISGQGYGFQQILDIARIFLGEE